MKLQKFKPKTQLKLLRRTIESKSSNFCKGLETFNIVIAKPIASITAHNVKKTLHKAIPIANSKNCNSILVDITDCPIGETLLEGFNLMSNFSTNTNTPLDFKIAVLFNPKLYPEERALFIEEIVSQKPNSTFRVFSDRFFAINWLKTPI